MDHGVSMGPIDGLSNMQKTITAIRSDVDAIALHKGIFLDCKKNIGDLPVFIHLNASTSIGTPLEKVLVTTVKEAKELGAFGVSMHIYIGNKYEGKMLSDLGKVSRQCKKLNIPLLAMVFMKKEVGNKIQVKNDIVSVSHAARLAYELGADIVKVSYPGNATALEKVIAGCPIPVVIDGGSKKEEHLLFDSIKDVVTANGAGISIGRNIFQNENPQKILHKINNLLND